MAALARPFANVLALVAGLLLLVALLFWARSGFATPPYVFMRGPGGMVAFFLAAVSQLGSGLIVANRRPDLVIGRLALGFAAILATAAAANAYLALAATGVELPIDTRWVAWLPSCLGFSGAALVAIWLGLVFPDGQLRGPGARALLRLSAFGAALTGLAMALQPGALLLFPSIQSPIAVDLATGGTLAIVTVVGAGLLVAGTIAVAQQLLARYSDAGRIVRAQIRWYIAAAVVLVLGFVVFLIALPTVASGSVLGEAILVGFMLSVALPPIAIVVAISRYHLFDIDTIISRAFVFGTLTAILAGLYTASIRLFNALFITVTGEASDVALVITTLVIAASFTPIKRRLETVVERRFSAGLARSPNAAGDSVEAVTSHGSAPMPPTGGVATIDHLVAAILADPAFNQALEARVRGSRLPMEPLEDGKDPS